VFIDDREYPLQNTNILDYLLIAASVAYKLPTLSLGITDVQHVMDKMGLQDGIPIRVTIKSGSSDTQTYLFRKFNHTRTFNGASYVYKITGYWDAPLYWNTTSSTSIRGTSSSVLGTIAEKCGLLYDGPTTNDAQLWVPQNLSWSTFARDIALCGYIDDESCTGLGVNLGGKLLYRNINKLPPATKKIVAYQYAADAFTAVDIAAAAASGFNNALSGYQNMRYAQSMIGNIQTKIDNLAFKSDSRAPLYNQALKTKLQRGPVRFGPIDVGNVHQNYEKASYQNIRYRNLFSQNLELLIQMATNLDLMELVNLSIQKEDTTQDVANSGIYTTYGRAIYIRGATYSEKIYVTRHGTNEQYVEG